MTEIEVKILEIDRPAVEKRLAALGAKKTFSGEYSARFFDYADMQLQQEKALLRLRREGEKLRLTYKRQLARSRSKIMDEQELDLPASEESTMRATVGKVPITRGLAASQLPMPMRGEIVPRVPMTKM